MKKIIFIFLLGFTDETFSSTVELSINEIIDISTSITATDSNSNNIGVPHFIVNNARESYGDITATTDNATVITGVPIMVDVLNNDTDSDGDLLIITEIIDPDTTVTALTVPGDTATLSSGTTVILRIDGRLDIISASDGVETFDYRVSNGVSSDTDTVTLTSASDEATADSIGFITTWNTTNTGTSASDTIGFLVNSDSDNYTIFWGDGTSTSNASGNISHTYASSGIYDVTIVGDFSGFAFNNGGDVDKITDIKQWGNVAFIDWTDGFEGADNINISASDTPDLINVTSLQDMFRNASNFNANIGAWDVTSVTGMVGMLDNTALSIVNYDATLNGWAAQVLQSGVTLGANGLKYSSNASAAATTLTNTYSWILNGHSSGESPTVVKNSMTITKGDVNTVVTTGVLSATDTDSTDASLSFTVGNVSNGNLTINGSIWTSGTNDTFTQQDIIDGNILYSHDDSNTTSDSFSFSITDGTNTLSGQTFSITVDETLNIDNLILNNITIYTDNNNLKIVGVHRGNAHIHLYNILGIQIFNTSFQGVSINNFSMPNNVKAGIYIVQLITETGKLNRKIIIK